MTTGSTSDPTKNPSRLKSWTAFPNVLWLILYLMVVVSMLPKYGMSIPTFARSLGVCIIPLGFGIAWNVARGEAKGLKWAFIIVTILFVVIFVLAQLQIAREAGGVG